MSQRVAVRNAADKEQVDRAREKDRSLRDRELNDLRFVLSNPQGRRFVWRYLESCGVFKSSFTGSSETFFNEGQRNIGLKLLADVTEADPESYLVMMKEQKQRDLNNE